MNATQAVFSIKLACGLRCQGEDYVLPCSRKTRLPVQVCCIWIGQRMSTCLSPAKYLGPNISENECQIRKDLVLNVRQRLRTNAQCLEPNYNS